jgi:hypothetical protein
MAEFILKDRNGKGQTFNTDAIFVQGTDGELVQFTQGGGGANPDANDPVYYVTFMNGDQVFYVRPVAENDNCADVVNKGWCAKPTKESTATEVFTYSGLSETDGGDPNTSILNNITADKTVYATYTVSERKYTITYLDEDGSVMKTEQLSYGAMPSYKPKKDGYLISWSPELTTVTADATYTAVWVVSYVVDAGQCGDTATWVFKNDGTLTISGSGAITDYSGTNEPWKSYRSSITKIVVEEGITRLGKKAFYSCKATEVILPEGLLSIGQYAFYGGKFTSITLPSSLTEIEQYAFYSSQITSIVIPDNVTRLEMGVLDYCYELTSITIGRGVTYIHCAQFKQTTKLTSATFRVTTGWTWSKNASETRTNVTYNLSFSSTAANALKASNSSGNGYIYWYRE